MRKEIAAMDTGAVARVRQLETMAAQMPQAAIRTEHALHGGMYARTVMIPAGVMITGALIKVATILIVEGVALMYGQDGTVELTGYNVLLGAAGRKQAFVAQSDIHLTMIFPTAALTVEQAEREFTDEHHLLASRGE